MKRFRLAAVAAVAVLLGTGASAQDGQQGSHNPVIKDGHPHQIAAPAHGANSFTRDQARGRLQKAGYGRISTLRKDANGVWRGVAYRGRSKVRVGVDYKGNVVH